MVTEALWTLRRTASELSISRTSLYRLLDRDETFPRPVQVGERRISFVAKEVQRGSKTGLGSGREGMVKTSSEIRAGVRLLRLTSKTIVERV